MEDFQVRVIEEEKELDIRVTSLKNFVESKDFEIVIKDKEEQKRLQEQLLIMLSYSSILNERIANFK